MSVIVLLMMSCLILLAARPARGGNLIQQPTVEIPTVTGTPTGPLVTVPIDQVFVYVRSGPGADPIYPKIGILVTGQQAPALGISGDYIQIVYMGVPGNVGWVHRLLVQIDGPLPEITPPATPTARVTPTLDPTLAAGYLVEVPPTPLATFTRPAPLVMPTYAPDSSSLVGGNVPAGFIIIGLGVVGLFGVIITLLRGR
jgi:hypothetical protein